MISSQSQAEDPCVQAAANEITQTYLSDPHLQVWDCGSFDTCGPITIKPKVPPRLDPTSVRHLQYTELAKIIDGITPGITNSTLISSTQKDEFQSHLQQALANTAGKDILSVGFTLPGQVDLQRYYVIDSKSDDTCSVEHLDFVLDDYDNG